MKYNPANIPIDISVNPTYIPGHSIVIWPPLKVNFIFYKRIFVKDEIVKIFGIHLKIWEIL